MPPQWCIAAISLAAVLGCGGETTPAVPETSASLAVESFQIQPSDTGAGISSVYVENAKHYVLQPARPGRKNVLVVFLGGTGSTPSDYSTIAEYAASLGYGVLDLQYANDKAIGYMCARDDACFAGVRGEASFGADVAYAPGMPSYSATQIKVDRENSIVGRLVSLLDYLAHSEATDQAYWAQFLAADAESPYSTTVSGKVYPAWSKIVISGHSQGGGDAAFIAMNLPSTTPVRRVVLLSSPNDAVSGDSASWIRATAATPVTRYWGLRAPDEGSYGSAVPMNWTQLGGFGVGGPNAAERDIGDGSLEPQGAQRLVLASSGMSLAQHDSTATNDPGGNFPANRSVAWAYLFTAGGSD